ncbi:MarR family transcriptional regulator [Novosphingobium taihuense]|uniref:DNA-binding MarR family transcriptional regulator n=1 Tax=Novosphingobium taihuense TaxID=260085 RepID=A0A7W7A7A2_9SPHN|nr:MarR family transcriptional regulator [Novosphingobium taihuense]MBB4611755.1 DNA-binding MarR family transcriptional regulator [Novosphingobium taihuense]
MQAAILPKDFENLRGLLTRVRELSASLDLAIGKSQELSGLPRHADDEQHQNQVLQYAKEIYAFRRKRSNWLPQDLFGEPAWDILLELFVMRMQGKSARVKNACIASGVPATTALRWINVLERKGLISSSADSVDHRVRWVWLEDEPYQKIYEMMAEQIGVEAHAPLPDAVSDAACVASGV